MSGTLGKSAGLVFASALMVGAFTNAFAFDEKVLEQQGDVYVVSLREGYLAHAAMAQRDGDATRAGFWQARAEKIEQQVARGDFDVTPLHPIAMETNNHYQRDVLMNAYEETAATVDSEAADEEPARVAKMQIEFEQWLYDAHAGESDRAFARDWDTWDAAMRDLVDDSSTPGDVSG